MAAHCKATVAILVGTALGSCSPIEEYRFYKRVESLAIGTTEQEVLNRLGPPSNAGPQFYLGQEAGHEPKYRAAAASSSVRYLFWRGGVADDVVCAVGLDRHGRVAYSACGGT